MQNVQKGGSLTQSGNKAPSNMIVVKSYHNDVRNPWIKRRCH